MAYGTHELTVGSFSFTIENEMFNPVGSNSIVGYKRDFNSEMYNSLAFNVATYPLITGLNLQATGNMLYTFKWSLNLYVDDADALEALLTEHRRLVATKEAEYWISLADSRLPIIEPGTATRTPIGYVIALAGGGVKYYAKFKLLLTSFNRTVFIPELIDQIELEAAEIV